MQGQDAGGPFSKDRLRSRGEVGWRKGSREGKGGTVGLRAHTFGLGSPVSSATERIGLPHQLPSRVQEPWVSSTPCSPTSLTLFCSSTVGWLLPGGGVSGLSPRMSEEC